MSISSCGKSKPVFRISFLVLLCIAILLCAVKTNSSNGSSSPVPCSWSSCLSKTNVDNSTIVCESVVKSDQFVIKEGCHNNQSDPGFKYLCCPKERITRRRQCGPEKVELVNMTDGHGETRQVIFNCTRLPIDQYIKEYVVKFFLYTRNNADPFDYKEIRVNDRRSLGRSGFIKNAPVKLIIHGFLYSAMTSPNPELRKYYLLRNATVNIISVDWRLISRIPCYNVAVHFTRTVGERCALLLKFLLEEKVVALKDIHVMGHSLGAHASGFTGKRFLDYTGQKLPRISGMDPSGPYYEYQAPTDRLEYTDADFVDNVHTARLPAIILPEGFTKIRLGTKQPLGHADFYVNGGGNQPGCRKLINLPGICDHFRSIYLFAESIQPPSSSVFRGRLCNNLDEALSGNCSGTKTTLMGSCTEINNSSRKLYYVKTRAKAPFALDERRPSDYQYCPNP